MAATGNASSEFLVTGAFTTAPTGAYSWSFWYLPLAAPATGAISAKQPFALTNAAGTYDVSFAWNHPDAATYKAAYHRNSDGTYALCQYPGTPPSGSWHHVAAIFNGTSTLTLYFDGVAVNSVAASAMTLAGGNPVLTVLAWFSGGFDDASVAQLTFWTVALQASDILSIFNGVDPTTIQNSSIISHSLLNTASITDIGPALVNYSATLNTTYFVGLSGGLAIGGADMPVKTQYNFSTSGGLAIGGPNMQVSSIASFTQSLVLSGATGRAPGFSAAFTLTAGFTQPQVYGAIAGEMFLGASFRCNSGSLANGRSRAFTTQ